MLYHDVAMKLPGFADPDAYQPARFQKMVQELRGLPYSVRLVYQTNSVRDANYLEVKMMLPTLTKTGVVSSWSLAPVPVAETNTACPFALCASVAYDTDLGFAAVGDHVVSAVRLLVKVLESKDDEDTAVPDTAQGLRVSRRVACALDRASQAEYLLTAAGLSSSVQWLVRAEGVFFVTATKRQDDNIFVVQARYKVPEPEVSAWAKYVSKTIAAARGGRVEFAKDVTPLKRKREIDHSAPAGSDAAMSTRSLDPLDV